MVTFIHQVNFLGLTFFCETLKIDQWINATIFLNQATLSQIYVWQKEHNTIIGGCIETVLAPILCQRNIKKEKNTWPLFCFHVTQLSHFLI